MDHDEARILIRRHFEEGLAPTEWARLRDHVRGCPDCKAVYDQAAGAEQALSGDPVAVPRLERMIALGAPDSPPVPMLRPRPRRLRWAAPLLAAAAGVLAVLAVPSELPPSAPMPRGGGPDAQDVWVTPYAKGAAGEVRRLEDTLGRDEALLFAYSNLKGSRGRWLAIVGRDAEGRAHWYHPGWIDPAAPPSPLEISAGQVDEELPEAIRAEHALGRLEICGLFMVERWDIAELDARIEEDGWPDGVARDCHVVEVRP